MIDSVRLSASYSHSSDELSVPVATSSDVVDARTASHLGDLDSTSRRQSGLMVDLRDLDARRERHPI